MSKNIVILFDGTSNEISADRTNILRLFGTLERSDRQIVYYDPGVGTFGASNAWSKRYRKFVEFWGLMTGWGLDENVKEAYRFLIENYDAGPIDANGNHTDRDRIYIFGFSRGAYTARVLAGFIHALGFISRHQLNLVDYAYNIYKDIPESEQVDRDVIAEGEIRSAFPSMRLYELSLRTSRPPIKLLGLFDTVASIIEPGKYWVQINTLPFTYANSSVEWVRHAVAIDERRTMYQPELWAPGQNYRGGPFEPVKSEQNFKEVWFAGVHGDVGGGYREEDSGQIKIPLDWMIRETVSSGLLYLPTSVDRIVEGNQPDHHVAPDPLAPLHKTMNGIWPPIEFIPRRVPKTSWRMRKIKFPVYIPLCDRRLIPADALIHESVRTRIAAGGYNPPNLPQGPTYVP